MTSLSPTNFTTIQTFSRTPYENATGTKGNDSRIPTDPYYLYYWIPCETILCFLTVVSVYVFICVTRYVVVHKSKPSRDVSGRQGKWLYFMCVVSSGLTVLRFLSDHVVAFLGSKSDGFCVVTITVSTVFFALALISIYIFLWMRQSIFYANPVLSKVLNKAVIILSWSTLIVMLLSSVCLTVLYNLPQVTGWVYAATKDGCMEISEGVPDIVPAITVATIVYFQLCLLALFLYPLLSRKTQRYRSAGAANKEAGDPANQNSYSQHPSSVSNTEDNGTDGGISSLKKSPEVGKKYIMKIAKSVDNSAVESENESGVDMCSPVESGKSETSSAGTPAVERSNVEKEEQKDEGQKNSKPDNNNKINESSRLNIQNIERKRMSAPKAFFRGSRLFNKRTQTLSHERPHSPIAKRSRAKTIQTVSLKLESQSGDSNNVERKSSGHSSKSEKKKKQRRLEKRNQQGRRMMAYLKKSFYIMLVCVFTDIIATVIQATILVPELINIVIFDISLMVNVVCIILSFRDWDIILFPICAKASNRRNSQSIVSKKSTSENKRRPDDVRLDIVRKNGYDSPSEQNATSTVQYHRNHLAATSHVPSFSTYRNSARPDHYLTSPSSGQSSDNVTRDKDT